MLGVVHLPSPHTFVGENTGNGVWGRCKILSDIRPAINNPSGLVDNTTNTSTTMKRETNHDRELPAVPKYVPVDQQAIRSFQQDVCKDAHAAFEYVTTPSRGDGWYERGVIEEIVEQDGVMRITLRTITTSQENVSETHFTVYLDSVGEVESQIGVYERDTKRDLQPTLSDEYPEPDERFYPEELPGCEEVGILVGAGVMQEYRFHEPKPSEEFWSSPEQVDVYQSLEHSTAIDIGVVNRTGRQLEASVSVDFPEWIEWKHGSDNGCGEFQYETTLEANRQKSVTLESRVIPNPGETTEVDELSVAITLGPYTEKFTHQIHVHE